jgi:hypothetical protein
VEPIRRGTDADDPYPIDVLARWATNDERHVVFGLGEALALPTQDAAVMHVVNRRQMPNLHSPG